MLVKFHKKRKSSEEILNELKARFKKNAIKLRIEECKLIKFIIFFLDFKNRSFEQNNKTSIRPNLHANTSVNYILEFF